MKRPLKLLALLVLVLSLFIGRKYLSNHALSQYIVIVDAGSAGSRIHVYHFLIRGHEEPELYNEVFEFTVPGLSSYAKNPKMAAESLDPLLDIAVQSVPLNYRSTTPISVKATAGLRLLGKESSNSILDAVKMHLEANYPFKLSKDSVVVLDGKDEGVFAWIQVNYILGNIGQNSTNSRKNTAAVCDLGGGSTQIVFEPNFGEHLDVIPGDHQYDLRVGDFNYTLYQHSHLGYGLMEARKTLHRIIAENVKGDINKLAKYEEVITPCMAPYQSRAVDIELTGVESSSLGKIPITMSGDPGLENAQKCIDFAIDMLKIDEACTREPCAFNGVYQPSLVETFENEDIYIFSYFYDRLFTLDISNTTNLFEIRDLADKVCQGPEIWKGYFSDEAINELERLPEFCLDLSFIFSILHHGYKIPFDRELKVVKTINGRDVGWTLGAALNMLDEIQLEEESTKT